MLMRCGQFVMLSALSCSVCKSSLTQGVIAALYRLLQRAVLVGSGVKFTEVRYAT